ncbi:RNA deprotection pyrophosphohydrolase [Oceanobacillus massiliensis]|uniref:RNA deprotection pyrophosphohydrolase n=1 Tax=Oceanobacillus massiliensis TaxID=1465765 RepID=UPI003016FC3D
MITFRDYYNNEVRLSFDDHPFSKDPRHVWVICRHKGKWLLTKHKERGLEFPGGKVEPGETAKEAAIREVMEETGGTIQQIDYIGQYLVEGRNATVVKNVYYAKVDKLTEQETYFETDGPILLNYIPGKVKYIKKYSFVMKDGVLENCMKFLKKNNIQL